MKDFLFYFSPIVISGNPLQKAFPSTTDQIFKYLDGDIGIELIWGDFKSIEQGNVQKVQIKNLNKLVSILRTCISRMAVNVGKVYSVHPRNVIQPLLRWSMLGVNLRKDETLNNIPVQTLMESTLWKSFVDICEKFYAPAILPIDARSTFDVGTLRKWLDPEYKIHNGDDVKFIMEVCKIL